MPMTVVTGSARSIGKAIATRLAKDGFDVAVVDLPSMEEAARATVAELEGLGVRAAFFGADVSEKDQMEAAVRGAVQALGNIDVMAANAGIALTKTMLDSSVEDFDRVMRINGRGLFLSYTLAARQMIEQGSGGKIIGASSIAGHQGFPNLGIYSASKFAVRAMTQACAKEWAEHGITVNAYCPGIVDTTMWEEIDRDLGAMSGKGKGESMAEMAKGIALGRVQRPEDVAAFVSYLASTDSDYMTGQSVLIDGGMVFV